MISFRKALQMRDSRLIRDLFSLSGGELFSKVLGFAVFAYLARVLGPEAYGSVELAVALALFFALIVDFGLGPIGARQLARDQSLAKYYAARIPAARLILALLAIPTMAGLAWAMGQPQQTFELACLFSLSLLAAPWLQRWLFQGLEMMSLIAPAQPIRMVVFAVGIVIWVHGRDDLMRVGYVEIAAAFTVALYYLSIQQLRVTPVGLVFEWNALRDLMREGRSLGLGQVVWALNQYLSTMLVAIYLASEDIAYFGAAGRIVLSLATFMHLYHFNLFPAVSKSLRDSTEAFLKITRPSLRVTSWVGIGVALPISFIATPLCVLVFGDTFGAAGPPLSIIAWTLPTILLAGHARFALIADGQQRYVLFSQLTGVAATLVLGGLLIPRYGPVGAGITMLVSFQIVWLTSHRYASQKVAPFPLVAHLVRPGLAALGAALLSAVVLGLTGWLGGLCAVLTFVASAPLLDRKLLSDAKVLAQAKGSARVLESAESDL